MFIKSNIKDIYYMKLYNVNNNEFDEYIEYFKGIYNKNELCNIIFDLSNIHINDFFYASQQLNFMKENRENTTNYINKTAIIVPNKIIENIINKVILNIYKPVKPNIITDTLENAVNFLS